MAMPLFKNMKKKIMLFSFFILLGSLWVLFQYIKLQWHLYFYYYSFQIYYIAA